MKLSISNIAWTADDDTEMYSFLKENGFAGLEIAPTRIFPDDPYSKLSEAEKFKADLQQDYNLNVSSMQSIWYGRTEKMHSSEAEFLSLLDYTKKAIVFAGKVGCNNLVFGNPKNRSVNSSNDEETAKVFFKELAMYAKEHNTVLSIEPNPDIYGTNYINYTRDAIKLVREINVPAFKVNIDFGTIIQNQEDLSLIDENIDVVNHVHISEPYLEQIETRKMHNELIKILKSKSYQNYVSIEMKNPGDLQLVKDKILYLKEIVNAN